MRCEPGVPSGVGRHGLPQRLPHDPFRRRGLVPRRARAVVALGRRGARVSPSCSACRRSSTSPRRTSSPGRSSSCSAATASSPAPPPRDRPRPRRRRADPMSPDRILPGLGRAAAARARRRVPPLPAAVRPADRRAARGSRNLRDGCRRGAGHQAGRAARTTAQRTDRSRPQQGRHPRSVRASSGRSAASTSARPASTSSAASAGGSPFPARSSWRAPSRSRRGDSTSTSSSPAATPGSCRPRRSPSTRRAPHSRPSGSAARRSPRSAPRPRRPRGSSSAGCRAGDRRPAEPEGASAVPRLVDGDLRGLQHPGVPAGELDVEVEPPVASEITPARMIVEDRANHQCLRRTKSKRVWPK